MVVAAGSREQRLVLFYAVAVFVAFLCGLLAMASFFRAEGRRLLLAASALAAATVTVTLAVDLARGYPNVSLLAARPLAATPPTLLGRAGGPSGGPDAQRPAETAPAESA